MNSSGSFNAGAERGTAPSPVLSAAAAGRGDRTLARGIDGFPDPGDFASLLVVKPSSLGDIIHALPAVALLAGAHPQLRVRWLVRPEFASLLRGLPMIHEVILFPRADFRGLRGAWRALRWTRTLRQSRAEGPELILDLQGLLRSGLLARARARRSAGDKVVGLSDAREGARWFHQWRLPVDPEAHAVRRQLAAVVALGARVPEDEFDLPWPVAGSRLPDWWPGRLGGEGAPFVVLHPYSRGHGKALDADSIGRLLDCLKGVEVVVVGQRPEERPLDSRERLTDASNRTSLPELAAILRLAHGVISVDSGPAHLAAALCPGRVVSIHSRAHPRVVGPWRADAQAWFGGVLAPMKDWLAADGGPVGDGGGRPPSNEELELIAKEAFGASMGVSARQPERPE